MFLAKILVIAIGVGFFNSAGDVEPSTECTPEQIRVMIKAEVPDKVINRTCFKGD